MNTIKSSTSIGFRETIFLMALMMSLTAMSIDTILPALAEIGRDLGVKRANDNQLIVSLLIFGMAVGQMFYGPLSDSFGRKKAIYLGFGIYIFGSLMSLMTASFYVMLAGRTLQGLGAAGPRIVTVALVRDQFDGRDMAQVMSIIMSVFILVPVVAPTLGQMILMAAHWRAIFGVFIVLSLTALIWLGFRQPETLPEERRIPFSIRQIAKGIREVCMIRSSFGYTLAAGFVFGSFFGYINSAQQIFQDIYKLGPRFPLFFGLVALSIGGALFFNSRLVNRFGMRFLSHQALWVISGLSSLFWAAAWAMDGVPPLWALMLYMMITFFGFGILIGNLNALAMEPLGHIAGIGAAVIGSFSTLISVPIGLIIGQCFNGTVLPLVGGFAVFSIISILFTRWAEYRKPAAAGENPYI